MPATHPLWRPWTPAANADRQALRLGRRQTPPGPPEPYQAVWADWYAEVATLIRSALGDQVVALAHVGSTAVAGLVAKPVVDVDLTVPDVSEHAAYLDRLTVVGFRLVFADDVAGDPHRQLTLAVPNTNLHVWGPGAVEPRRHALFAGWLRSHPEDRDRYARAKRAAAAGTGRYNDHKSGVVYDIYERAFATDPAYPHDPHPRPEPGRPA